MDWEALSVMLAKANRHLMTARTGVYFNIDSTYWNADTERPIRSKADIRERLHGARERIDNALQALQE